MQTTRPLGGEALPEGSIWRVSNRGADIPGGHIVVRRDRPLGSESALHRFWAMRLGAGAMHLQTAQIQTENAVATSPCSKGARSRG